MLNRKTGQWKQNYHHQDAFHRADIRHHLHLLESVPIFIFSLDNNLDRVRANYLAPALFENTPPAVQASVCYHPMKTSCPNVQKKKKNHTADEAACWKWVAFPPRSSSAWLWTDNNRGMQILWKQVVTKYFDNTQKIAKQSQGICCPATAPLCDFT